jgi:spoIIIJ-associated protein
MDYSEKWGRDVDEAVRLALEDLGLTEDQVMVTVIEEPTKGFLGIGQKLAKVRVEKLQVTEEPEHKEEHSGNRKVTKDLRKKNRPDGGSAQGQSGGGERRDRSDRGERGERNGGGNRRDRNDRGDRSDRGGRNDRGDRNGGRRDRNRDESAHADIPEFDFSDKPTLSERPEGLTEIAENDASKFLSDVLLKMGLDVGIKAFENEECVYLEVSGEDSKTVIGKRGQTLDSIQYLTNLVANKERTEYRRVIIDVEGYRSRREKTLERLAAKLARKVLTTGRSVKLEPMNPYERKVIHSTLQTVDGVTTRSEGEEPYRRVIIDKIK